MTIDQTELEQILNTSIEEQALSRVISIRQKDHVLYARAAGDADQSNKIENSLETRFGIASGTKFFTTLAMGKLIEAPKTLVFHPVEGLYRSRFSALFAGDHHTALPHPYLWYS